MARTCLCFLLAWLCAAVSPRSYDTAPPGQLAVDGAGTLPLAGHARRTHLLDTVETYRLAVYVAGGSSPERLASADVAKALRIEVTYVEDPRRSMRFDWRRELVPALEPAAAAHLRGAFSPLRHGDVIVIEYAPGKGTTVRVSKAVAVAEAHHDLMLAFLDHWIGQRPMSEEIKRALLASS